MIELLVGPDKKRVDTEDISNVSIKYSVKDIKNYGKRNSSYSKPIKVLRTKNSEEIFKNLTNVDVINGYDISKIIEAELVEEGLIILKGSLIVEEVYPDYYEVVVSSPQFNLLDEIGDSLIKGNDVSSNDITFDPDYYAFNYTRDNIRSHLSTDPSKYGKGFQLTLIDWDDTIDDLDNVSPDYLILPSIAAKEIWDAIFDKYGYTYEFSNDISTYMNKLYIPFNDDIAKFTENWTYSNYRLGDPSTLLDFTEFDGRKLVGISNEKVTEAYGTPTLDNIFSGINSVASKEKYNLIDVIYGLTLFDINNYDSLIDKSHLYRNEEYSYKVEKNGLYDINTNIIFVRMSSNILSLPTTTMDVGINIVRDGNIVDRIFYNGISDEDMTSTDASTYFSRTTSDVQLYKDDRIYVTVSNNTESDIDWGVDHQIYHGMSILWDPSSCIRFTLKNDINFDSSVVFTMNDLLPNEYKQSDFITDIFKIFNCYVEVDKNNPKKIIINSYNEYFNDSKILDWTEKVNNSDIKFESVKNQFPKTVNFTYNEGEDIYNNDFKIKYDNNFGFKIINNDSNFVTKTNDINLSLSPTIFKSISR